MNTRALARIGVAAAIAMAGTAAYVVACGPFLRLLRPVETIRPARLDAYNRGELGVVREHFARRYLVQAFRRFSGKPAIAVAPVLPTRPADPASPASAAADPKTEWRDLHQRVAASAPDVRTDRRIADYQWITNCLDGAFVSAAATGRARIEKYGAGSGEARDWFRAQDAVLANCAGDALVLPEPAPAAADALTRADRAYQTAAAYFYATQFDEAARRFRAIADDTASPWRPYGRYLTGRTLLRQATIPETLDPAKMAAAKAEFEATLADRTAAFLHDSARGLLQVIAFRTEPVRLLRDLTPAIAGGATVTADQLEAYEHLMDALVGNVVTYAHAASPQLDAIAATAELNDWILVMQGTGDSAAARAVAQWKRNPSSAAWLVAALWKIPAAHPDAADVLGAGARLAPASPAFLTASFLRVRLMAERGETEAARSALAALPRASRDSADPEAINLLDAERFMLARSLDELLQAAPRRVVSARWDSAAWTEIDPDADPVKGNMRDPVFDEDAALVFSRRLPLARLVDASTSELLPARLRLRVAAAAFARAWLLRRDDAAMAVAPVLRTLSPSMAADVRSFEAAAPADRHVAGLRLVLRTPGMRAEMSGVEDDEDYKARDLRRTFDHTFRRNWWCEFSGKEPDDRSGESTLLPLLYRSGTVPFPGFLSADERTAVDRERLALAKLGTAPNYLAGEAIAWAKSRPQDLDAAEALAQAVEGTRWGCTDARTTASSRAAFQTLHQLFPKSEWARKTKYWY